MLAEENHGSLLKCESSSAQELELWLCGEISREAGGGAPQGGGSRGAEGHEGLVSVAAAAAQQTTQTFML